MSLSHLLLIKGFRDTLNVSGLKYRLKRGNREAVTRWLSSSLNGNKCYRCPKCIIYRGILSNITYFYLVN